MKRFLLHLGYPKTGTTTLQASLFAKAPNVNFIGKLAIDGRETLPDSLDAFRTLVNYGSLYHVQTEGPATLRRVVDDTKDAETVLASLEGLTNPFVDTHYTQPKDIYRKATDIRRILSPLIDSGVDIRILVTLRRQSELLPSLFSQCYLQGFSSGLFKPNYEAFLDFLFEDRVLGFGPDFQYDAFLDHCGQLFGAQNVYAAAMGGFLSGTPCQDTATMAQFMDLPESDCIALIGKKQLNVRKAGSNRRHMMSRSPGVDRFEENTGLSLKRRAFGAANMLRLRRGKRIYWDMVDHSDRIDAYYAPSNSRLADQYDISF